MMKFLLAMLRPHKLATVNRQGLYFLVVTLFCFSTNPSLAGLRLWENVEFQQVFTEQKEDCFLLQQKIDAGEISLKEAATSAAQSLNKLEKSCLKIGGLVKDFPKLKARISCVAREYINRFDPIVRRTYRCEFQCKAIAEGDCI